MKSIYLGGAFGQFTPEEVLMRQQQMADLLDASIKLHTPQHQRHYPQELGDKLEATLTHRDMMMVKKADVLVLDCLGAKQISRGSLVEIGWATAMGKPYILIAEERNPHLFNMSKSLTPFCVATREEAADIANSLLT